MSINNKFTMMRKLFLCFGLFLTCSFSAQDSLKAKKGISLFDVEPFIGVQSSINYFASKEELNGLTRCPEVLKHINSNNLEQLNPDKPSGFIGGFNFIFKCSGYKSKIINRIKPRFGLGYKSLMTMYEHKFENSSKLSSRKVPISSIDTTKIDKDSMSYHNALFSNINRSVWFNVGFNFDIIKRKKIIFYAGLNFMGSKSTTNITFLDDREWIIEEYNYPTGIKTKVIKDEVTHISYKELPCSDHAFKMAIGFQERFLVKKPFTVGIFGEISAGWFSYKNSYGLRKSYLQYDFSFGMRLNFDYHKS